MTTVRGRPPGLAGGINGSKMAHWASLRSEGYDLRAVVGGMSASQQGCNLETLIPHDLNDWVALWIDSERFVELLSQPFSLPLVVLDGFIRFLRSRARITQPHGV